MRQVAARNSLGQELVLRCLQHGPQGDAQGDIKVRREEYDEITDKIPMRPVSAPEAAGWSVLIAMAYAISGAILYTVITQLFMETPEVAAFNAALDKVREDPRIVVRLGESIKGYGSDARGKAARHRISHRIYNDTSGQEHVQVQFHIAGNGQRGIVSADMYKERGVWQYAYLYVDVEGRRLILIEPQMRGVGVR